MCCCDAILYWNSFSVIFIFNNFSHFLNDFGFNLLNYDPNFVYKNLPLIYHRVVIILASFIILLIHGYNIEMFSKMNYLKINKKKLDLKKDDEIFNNLVPEFVREKMRMGIRGAAVDFEIVSILFCDISDFDKLVDESTPKDLISLLDKIYNLFDQLCDLHGMQKIETVGKTYMATGGLKECEKDMDKSFLVKHHAVRAFELGLDMIDIMQKMTLSNGELVKVKIGIHTGDVLSAVIGNPKPQFSLIGDAVNTTSRMCSNSSDQSILCSEYKNKCRYSYSWSL